MLERRELIALFGGAAPQLDARGVGAVKPAQVR
jgi:hypothetical protein